MILFDIPQEEYLPYYGVTLSRQLDTEMIEWLFARKIHAMDSNHGAGYSIIYFDSPEERVEFVLTFEGKDAAI